MSAYASWAIPTLFGDGQQAVAAPNVDLTKQRVLIGTPTRGSSVGDNHRLCIDALREHLRDQVLPLGTIPAMRDGEQWRLMNVELARDARLAPTGVLAMPHDLARTRSRMIRLFLETSNAEWLLFVDDDVYCREPHVVLQNMLTVALATDTHVVGAMYPGKKRDEEALVDKIIRDVVHELRSGDDAVDLSGEDLHKYLAERVPHQGVLKYGFTVGSMRFWRRPDYNPEPPHPWFLPVNGVGFGFCLISRIAAIALTERFRHEVPFPDHFIGGTTVDLCAQINDGFDSYSEDYSFNIRADAGGFPVFAYIGPGAPLTHDGHDSFEAAPETMYAVKTAGNAR